MRAFIQKRVDELHAEIQRLVQLEKNYYDRKNPNVTDFYRHIVHTRIEVDAWDPQVREK